MMYVGLYIFFYYQMPTETHTETIEVVLLLLW